MTETEYSMLIYTFVAKIPQGKVATFGMLAALAGNPGAARRAAKAVACAPDGLPCHRVVKSGGELVPERVFGPGEQRARLISEGIQFHANGRVDIKNHLWQLEEAHTK